MLLYKAALRAATGLVSPSLLKAASGRVSAFQIKSLPQTSPPKYRKDGRNGCKEDPHLWSTEHCHLGPEGRLLAAGGGTPSGAQAHLVLHSA